MGPTAVGKTALAIALAKHLQTEIISADSRQIYREMQLGTAKPSEEVLAQVKHHFINSHSIEEEYNAGQYERDVNEKLNQLFGQYQSLVLVGGSGLYIKAALEGFDTIPEVPEAVRERLEERYEEKGLAWLQEELATQDPDLFEGIDQQNPHRLIRALEVKLHTGQSIQSFRGVKKKEHAFRIVKIGLELERKVLYQRIDSRMDAMIEQGLFEEAKNLSAKRELNALQTVGYQEIFDFLEGKCDREEAVRLLKRNSRRYAKRQLTWFKRDAEITWLDASEDTSVLLNKIVSL
jgi:tRNA dimethylallyltransferase